jgi:Protein of unknown function (DUF2281)
MTIAEMVYAKLRTTTPEIAQEVLDFLEFLEARSGRTAVEPLVSWDDIVGALSGSKAFERDPVEIQRELRADWDHEGAV